VDRVPRVERLGREHRVKFHESDSELVTTAAHFLSDALGAGGRAVVIATPQHRREIEKELTALGHSLFGKEKPKRYLGLDAASALETIRIGAKIDPKRFDVAIGDVMVEAAEAGGPLAAFGEMVDLLWEEGLAATALELEEEWNLLADRLSFRLLCGYSLERKYAQEFSTARLLCLAHSRLIPPNSYLDSQALDSDSSSVAEAKALFFPAESAAMKSRQFVDAVLERWSLQFVADETLIVASELANNAITHARSPFEVRLIRKSGTLRIEVSDGCIERPSCLVGSPSGRAGSGRGLAMVDALAATWGSDEGTEGKSVWAELPCIEARQSAP
jgi:anti-sigma regulatory factor (Ser/Thr protein kinase)